METITRLRARRYDVLVIGGGVTGAGTALDAVTRGLDTALVEKRDWAAGTSSPSGKLIHGGLRYLEQLDFGLVREALKERSLLLGTLAPHLCRPIRFIYPIRHRLWERVYMGAGLVLYDTMGGAGAVPRHRHLTRTGATALAPGMSRDQLVGALSFYDVQIDDARHTMELVRTAAAHGADAAAALAVVGVVKDGDRVVGVRVRDAEAAPGEPAEFEIRAKVVINATGVWTDELQRLAGGSPTFQVAASKGVHLLVRRAAIDSSVSMFVRAEDSVLFVRSWGRHWLVGTTDTPYDQQLDHPAPTAHDVDYLLRNINRVLERPVTLDDVDGVFAGLRPLVRQNRSATSKMSREHAVETGPPGMVTVAGGKYTTYRIMARDALDEAIPALDKQVDPCVSDRVPLVGAVGYAEQRARLGDLIVAHGLTPVHGEHLLRRYGSMVRDIDALLRERPELSTPLPGAEDYLEVEVVYAVTHEGALHIDDVMTRRTHIAVEARDRGVAAAEVVVRLMGGELGWSPQRQEEELTHYHHRVAAEDAASRMPDDEAAARERGAVSDPRVVAVAERVPE